MITERPLDLGGNSVAVEYQRFKERENFSHVVGIIGGSEAENIPYYQRLLVEQLNIVKQQVGNFAIVSGGTEGGIPEMALDVGMELGLPTIGVFPEQKSKYAMPQKTSFSISVPSHPLSQVSWGVETPTLIGIPDAFLLIGGGWGSLTEISMIMKRNESLLRNGRKPIPVISVTPESELSAAVESLTNSFGLSEGIYIPVRNNRLIAEIITSSL